MLELYRPTLSAPKTTDPVVRPQALALPALLERVATPAAVAAVAAQVTGAARTGPEARAELGERRVARRAAPVLATLVASVALVARPGRAAKLARRAAVVTPDREAVRAPAAAARLHATLHFQTPRHIA